VERKDLEDARLKILSHKLVVEAKEGDLRAQAAELVVRERQLVERQMRELAVAQKRLEDLQAS
jgi:hypothetical protein